MEDHIVIADCCLKQDIKKFSDFLVHKQLTDHEVLLLCIYQFAMTILIDVVLLKFQVAYSVLIWLLADIGSTNIISMTALFINSLILIQMIENIKEFVHALRCKCDYREHPELYE